MALLALGMACVAFGAKDIEPGAKTASVQHDLVDPGISFSHDGRVVHFTRWIVQRE